MSASPYARRQHVQSRSVRLIRFLRLSAAGEVFSGIRNLPDRFLFQFFGRLSVPPESDRTTIEESTPLYGERLVVNIPDDLRTGLQKDISTLNRAFDLPVHNHSL